nr:hypothetical protein CFP56_44236 [Quercus suber]
MSHALSSSPGLSDANTIRAGIAHKYVQACDGLLAFDQIKRCLTNPALDKILGTYCDQFKERMTVVITHADDTGGSDDVIAKTLKGEGQSVGEYFDLAKAIRDIEREIRQMTARLSRIKARSHIGNRALKLAAFEDLKNEISKRREDLQPIRNRQFEALIDARNTNIKRKMQSDKRRYMPNGVELEVHCISNTHYKSLCRGSTTGGLQLDTAHTGVPALRAHLLMLTALPRLRATEELIDNATIFTRGVQLWVEDTPVKNAHGIMEVVEAPAKCLNDSIEEFSKQVTIMLKNEILHPLRKARRQCLQGAYDWIANKLKKWHHSSILAFFNKNGNHKTRAIGPEVWNERLTEVQTDTIIRPSWPKIEEKQRKLLDVVRKNVIPLMEAYPDKLNRIGKMKRKFKVLETDLQEKKCTAFDGFATSLENNLIEQSNLVAFKLKQEMGKILEGMRVQFETFLLREGQTPEARQARRELASVLKTVQPKLDGIVAEMEAIKAKYPEPELVKKETRWTHSSYATSD